MDEHADAPSPARAAARDVAAFDVDGTLTVSDCVLPFLRRVGGWRSIVLAIVRRPGAIALAATRRDRDAFKAVVVGEVFAGRAVAEVEALGVEFAAGVLAGRMRADTAARLRWHRRRGDVVVLVSASLGPYLRPLGDLLGVDAVLCTEVAADGAGVRYANRLDGANCRAGEKARRLGAWLDAAGFTTDDLWAYGDSAGDVAMLAMAPRPVWVKGVTLSPAPILEAAAPTPASADTGAA